MGGIIHRPLGMDWPPAALIALLVITGLLPVPPRWRAILQLVLLGGIVGWYVWRFVRGDAGRDTIE